MSNCLVQICDSATRFTGKTSGQAVRRYTFIRRNSALRVFDTEIPYSVRAAEPSCDWSLFEQAELPAPEVRHYVGDAGDNLYVWNLYETRRIQYTLYNALGRTPEAWRDGKPLAKVYLTIPAEYEAYTPVFWPWHAVELEKKAAAVPRGRFRCEAWDAYVDGQFMQTQYYTSSGERRRFK